MLEVPWNKNFNKKQDFKTFAKPKVRLHILMFTKSKSWTSIRLVKFFTPKVLYFAKTRIMIEPELELKISYKPYLC